MRNMLRKVPQHWCHVAWLAMALAWGCNQDGAVDSEGVASASPVRAVRLAGQDEDLYWQPLWDHSVDADTWAGGKVDFLNLKVTGDASGLSGVLDDGTGSVVFSFARTLDTDRCTALRLRAFRVRHAVVWWARDTDLSQEGGPFGLDRMAVLDAQWEGVVGAGLWTHPNWNGQVAALRFDFYGRPDEAVLLQRLEGLTRSSDGASLWGKAYEGEPVQVGLMDEGAALIARTMATGAAPSTSEAVARLDGAVERAWWESPSGAQDVLGDLGIVFLEQGDLSRARNAFAAATLSAPDTMAYLDTVAARLGEAQRKALWGEEQPYLSPLYNGDFEVWPGEFPAPLGFRAPSDPSSTIQREENAVASGALAVRQTWQRNDGAVSGMQRFHTILRGLKKRTTYRFTVHAHNQSQNTVLVVAWQVKLGKGYPPVAAKPAEKLGNVVSIPPGSGFQTYTGTLSLQKRQDLAIVLSPCCFGKEGSFPATIIWDCWELRELKASERTRPVVHRNR